MRKKISANPSFFFKITCDREIIKQYRNKYDAIDKILDGNSKILNIFHSKLSTYGDNKQRLCPYSSEQIMRMAIVKQIENWSYRETIIRVSESDFLRNFTRIGMGKIMSFGFLCGAINQISVESWSKINEQLDTYAITTDRITPDQIRMDSTVCETNIHYPTDSGLLWDSYRTLSRLIRQSNEIKPRLNLGNRFHDNKIKQLHTYISTHSTNKNKSTKRKVNQRIKTLIERVDSVCESACRYIDNAKEIGLQNGAIYSIEKVLPLVQQVVRQSKRIHIDGEKVPASERIFSIFEEHTELLIRGKSNKPIEFGHLVSIAQTKEKYISFYNVSEKSLHDTKMKDIALKEHKKKFGELPNKFTADKNYYVSMDEINKLEEEMSLCAIGKKGRRNLAEEIREHSDEFKEMQKFRAGIEGSISFLKRVFGLFRCVNKGFKHFACTIGRTVFCHNLVILSRA